MIETSAELALHLGGEVTTLATCIRVIRRDGVFDAATPTASFTGSWFRRGGCAARRCRPTAG